VKLEGIHEALRAGCRLHAFLSGGGLRVVRLEGKRGVLKGYGEHPAIEDALSHADEDYRAGGRPYDEVYGGTKPHYLTGSSTPTGPLDAWVQQGQTFDARQDGAEVVVEMRGWEHTAWPENAVERVKVEGSIEWSTPRGFTYRATPIRFANGEIGASGEVVKAPPGKRDPWFYRVVKTGRGPCLMAAVDSALTAEADEAREGQGAKR